MSLLNAASPTIIHTIGDRPFEFPKLSYRDKQTLLRTAARERNELLAENRRLAGLAADGGLLAEFKSIDAQLAADDAFVNFVNQRGALVAVLGVIVKKMYPEAGDDQLADAIEAIPPPDRFEIVLKCAGLRRRTQEDDDGEAEEEDDAVPFPHASGRSSAGS